MLAETDAPYLTPVPHRGKPNSPAMTAYTIRYLASLKNLDVAAFCATRQAGRRASAGNRVTVRLLGAGDIRGIAGRLGVHPTKRLGQNFVVEPGTVRQIAALAAVRPGDVILEVGPGLGSLTLALLEAAAAAGGGRRAASARTPPKSMVWVTRPEVPSKTIKLTGPL